jgi:hypothetical protein
MSRNTWLALLVCLNLLLLTGILLFAYSPPTALAQGAGLAGNYLAVTGEIQNEYDALYLIDLRSRTLHVFCYDRTTRQLAHRGYRSLERDFRQNRD